MKKEILDKINNITKECMLSGDEEMVLVGHLLHTVVIATNKKELPYLSKAVEHWVVNRTGGDTNTDIDITPPNPN